MSIPRRTFLQVSAMAAGAAAVGGTSAAAPQDAAPAAGTAVPHAERPLRILILGGTGFTGPHHVRYAVARGHQVTVFNRGQREAELPAGVERLVGDRNEGELDALKGRSWDVVLDIPSTLPRWVREAAQLLKDSAGHFMFISSMSVYADFSEPGVDETAPTIVLENPDSEDQNRDFGGLKALAEREAERAFPGRTTIIRPGLIVGPGDGSDRFNYWPVRIDRGGEVLAPGTPDDRVQIIDARDLAEWVIRMAEMRAFGVYNAVGPIRPYTMAELLYGVRAVTAADVRFTWVPADFLAEHKVRPWSDMPVWIPPSGAYAGFGQRSNTRALEKGLTYRPLAVTARDTLDWFTSLPAERQAKMRAGLSAEREAEVLAAWHAKAATPQPA